MNYALLFPGQGSQAVGMLSGHADPVIAETWLEASNVLGWDMAKLVSEGPVEELNRTERTQPALLAAGIAIWRLWQKQGLPAPAALAGHSLGEYTALVAAGSIDFAAALHLVELRGQLMQEAVPTGVGAMAAVIGMEDAAVENACQQNPTGQVLEPVNYNSPGQVVVAGQAEAVEWFIAHGKSLGARMVMKLPVSVPSHCSLMCPAAEKLAMALEKTPIHAPVIPVLHNLDAQPRDTAEGIRQALKEQLYRPVRWTGIIQNLQARGITAMAECGPGKVLAGLNKRISKDIRSAAMEDAEGFQAALALVKG